MKKVALLAHRWVGLFLSVFLVVTGLTGSIIVFREELDPLFAPELYAVSTPPPDAELVDPVVLRESLLASLPPGCELSVLELTVRKGRPIALFVRRQGAGADGDNQFFYDPYSGARLGSRRWGELSQGVHNLIPFLYRLHSSLALDLVGEVLLGVVALLWTIDCFVGAYLTFPARSRQGPEFPERQHAGSRLVRDWLVRWLRAWRVKAKSLASLVFSWHRASGLWLWGMLLIIAWSAVGLNLHPVYHPVMSSIWSMSEPGIQMEKVRRNATVPKLSWSNAKQRGEALMRQQGEAQGFTVLSPERLRYFSRSGYFQYRARTTRDLAVRYPQTSVWFDGDTGAFGALTLPQGETSGDTITNWINALHFGTVSFDTDSGWGNDVYRAFISLLGVCVTVLSATGVWLWWKKRSKRVKGRNRRLA